nr:unnamed protein product [Callosobruchus chinensis]
MIRGLVPNWKQPIYYHFDQANFIVVAIVSDMGIGNVALWRELNVGHDKKCHFAHRCDDSLKIFVWADVPDLIKLVRNLLIDHMDLLVNGYVQRFNFCPIQLQKLLLMQEDIDLCLRLLNGWKLQLFNDWFDLINSRSKFVISCPGRNAFGTDIEKQKELLHKMTEVINIIRVGKHKNLIPFQKGIIISNKSLIEMFEYVSEKYKVEYVLTSRLNQDVLENFFSYIRGMGGSNDHPSSTIFTENRNTAESTEPCFFNVLNEPSVETIQEDICITQRMLSNLVETDI